jgi:LPS O-antigen subunit length determinant protein (WzzB/FepE family)
MSGAWLAVMIVMMVIICGGMFIGAGVALLRRSRRPRSR